MEIKRNKLTFEEYNRVFECIYGFMKKLEIPNIKKIKKNYYKGLWCESDISIQFVSHDVKECLTICGKSFPAVKYREKNILIVDRVMCYSQYETQRNLEKAFAVTQAIIYLNEEDNN